MIILHRIAGDRALARAADVVTQFHSVQLLWITLITSYRRAFVRYLGSKWAASECARSRK